MTFYYVKDDKKYETKARTFYQSFIYLETTHLKSLSKLQNENNSRKIMCHKYKFFSLLLFIYIFAVVKIEEKEYI